MRLVWVVIPFILIGIIGVQESHSQYLGSSYNEMTDEERNQYDEEKRLRLEKADFVLNEEYPNYYYCEKILQIPFICTFLMDDTLYFFLFGIIGSAIIGIIVMRKRK